jgi:hypothetical protein
MAMTQREKAALDDHITREQTWETDSEGLPVIHITKTIATLTLGNGDMHPVEAAYLAIARADEDGRFEFTIPHEDGGKGHFVLTVEREFTDAKAKQAESY